MRGWRTSSMRRFDWWSPEILAGVRPQFHRLRRPVVRFGPFHRPGADDLRMTSLVHTFLPSSIVYTPNLESSVSKADARKRTPVLPPLMRKGSRFCTTPTQFRRTLRRSSLSHVATCGAVPLDCARPPGRAPAGHHAALNSFGCGSAPLWGRRFRLPTGFLSFRANCAQSRHSWLNLCLSGAFALRRKRRE